MNIRDLQREAHAIAKAHGWWDTERTFGDLIALVHSKLSEALEAYRELGTTKTAYTVDADGALTKPEGVPYELADVVIRVADMAEWYGWDLQVYPEELIPNTGGFGDWIAKVHSELSLAYMEVDSGAFYCSRAVEVVYYMAAHYGINLDAAIEAKREYNRGREPIPGTVRNPAWS